MRPVLMATLLGGSLIAAGLCAPALADSSYGSMSAPSAVIQPGCHDYGYSYVIHPPANTDWDFLVTVVAPDGTQEGTKLWASGTDGLSGSGVFQLCSSQTPPGVYTLRGELDYSNGSQEAPTQVFLTPAHFTLSSAASPASQRPRHHRKHRHHRQHHQQATPHATPQIPAL